VFRKSPEVEETISPEDLEVIQSRKDAIDSLIAQIVTETDPGTIGDLLAKFAILFFLLGKSSVEES
jgi:uncharacterized protein YjgD (DUF1641 family)